MMKKLTCIIDIIKREGFTVECMLQLLSLFGYIQFFSILLWGGKLLNTNRKGDVAKTVVL